MIYTGPHEEFVMNFLADQLEILKKNNLIKSYKVNKLDLPSSVQVDILVNDKIIEQYAITNITSVEKRNRAWYDKIWHQITIDLMKQGISHAIKNELSKDN